MQLKKEDYNKKYNKNRLNLSTRRLPSSKVATSHWKQNWAKEAKIWQKKKQKLITVKALSIAAEKANKKNHQMCPKS